MIFRASSITALSIESVRETLEWHILGFVLRHPIKWSQMREGRSLASLVTTCTWLLSSVSWGRLHATFSSSLLGSLFLVAPCCNDRRFIKNNIRKRLPLVTLLCRVKLTMPTLRHQECWSVVTLVLQLHAMRNKLLLLFLLKPGLVGLPSVVVSAIVTTQAGGKATWKPLRKIFIKQVQVLA